MLSGITGLKTAFKIFINFICVSLLKTVDNTTMQIFNKLSNVLHYFRCNKFVPDSLIVRNMGKIIFCYIFYSTYFIIEVRVLFDIYFYY